LKNSIEIIWLYFKISNYSSKKDMMNPHSGDIFCYS
jgi:hypothetical protein